MADAGSKLLRGLLDVFLLESLEQAPKHGYALLREMADAFGTEPNRNRLYPLLARMVRDDLIAERSEEGVSRTLYALTEAGRAALASYRQLPPGFHERIARVWGGAPPGAADEAPNTDARMAPPAPAPAPSTASRTIPIEAAPLAPAPADAPYPCVDARVAVEKNPRTGDMRLVLTGCPMGAYEYCPRCPVAQSVEGLRRLTFS